MSARWTLNEYAAHLQRQQATRVPPGEPRTLGKQEEAGKTADVGVPPWENVYLTIPEPMSINNYWCHVQNRRVTTTMGRNYRDRVGMEVLRQWDRAVPMPLPGRLAMTLHFYPGDHRVHDLDNLLKPVQDALANAGVYANDSQIDWLQIMRCGVRKPARLDIHLRPYKEVLSYSPPQSGGGDEKY